MTSELLSDVHKRIVQTEQERAELVDLRNQAMGEAAQIVNKMVGLNMRRVLFHILDEHDREVECISEP